MSSGLEDFSLFELFRMEAEEQVRVLQAELLNLENGASSAKTLEALMRAAHSLKGAARIIGLDTIVQLTHAMEDRFVAAQGGLALETAEVDRMLTATDWLARLQANTDEDAIPWLDANTPEILEFVKTFATPAAAEVVAEEPKAEVAPKKETAKTVELNEMAAPVPNVAEFMPRRRREESRGEDADVFGQAGQEHESRERYVRIAAERFDQLQALASEVLVASRKLATESEVLERNRRALAKAQHVLEKQESTAVEKASALRDVERQIAAYSGYIEEVDLIARTNERTAERLYQTILTGRLRPFSEGITGVPRLVRDTARNLGKQVKLEVLGEKTRIDREILEKLEAPISHLVTNAIDHGIETPEARMAAGKSAEAHLRLHGRLENGRLVITVRDDGHGITRDTLRKKVVQRGLINEKNVAALADDELFEFLFLPGFSTKDEVSTTSGRGVGLNVVQSMVQEAGGAVTVSSEEGVGTVFRLTLPVTRSMLKVIRVQCEGEFYAIPMVRIERVLHAAPVVEEDGSVVVEVDGEKLPVRLLGRLLGLTQRLLTAEVAPMMICSGVAFVVDRLLDPAHLPVRQMDSRLGMVPGVAAATLDEHGMPLLILDMEDLVHTAMGDVTASTQSEHGESAPQVLMVDDSHTVREIVRRLLVKAGYTVTTAQNGQEAWNLLRLHEYDLLISDVDMPQMNGIELVTRVRENPRMARMPVIILSYKNNEQDRQRGLEAGADFYLTKGDFQSNAFLQAVVDLIGPADMLESEAKA